MTQQTHINQLKTLMLELDSKTFDPIKADQFASQVVLLLSFNPELREKAKRASDGLIVGRLGRHMIEPQLEAMRAVLREGISLLEGSAGKSGNSLNVPDKVTFRWLFEHVSVLMWLAYFSTLLAAFGFGVAMGRNETFVALFGGLL